MATHFLVAPSTADEYATNGDGDHDVRIVLDDGAVRAANQEDTAQIVELATEFHPLKDEIVVKPGCEAWAEWFWAAALTVMDSTVYEGTAVDLMDEPDKATSIKQLQEAIKACSDLTKLAALKARDSRTTIQRLIDVQMARYVYPDAPYDARKRQRWVETCQEPGPIKALLSAGAEYGVQERRASVLKAAELRLHHLNRYAGLTPAHVFVRMAMAQGTAKAIVAHIEEQTDVDGLASLHDFTDLQTVKKAVRIRLRALRHGDNPGWPLISSTVRAATKAIAECIDIAVVQAALVIEKADDNLDVRESIVALLVKRTTELRDAIAAPIVVEPETVIESGYGGELTGGGIDTLGGSELGGDIEGLGGDFGGQLGTGGNEVGGALGGEVITEQVGGGKKRNWKKDVDKRVGAGCKQPGEVDGFVPGRVLCVQKNHRANGWGRCDYSVRCEADGGYRLVAFSGAREVWTVEDSEAIVAGEDGKHWPFVSEMFFDLLGMAEWKRRAKDPATGRRFHHKQTLRRYFKLDKQT